jgi:hypothetical protein
MAGLPNLMITAHPTARRNIASLAVQLPGVLFAVQPGPPTVFTAQRHISGSPRNPLPRYVQRRQQLSVLYRSRHDQSLGPHTRWHVPDMQRDHVEQRGERVA